LSAPEDLQSVRFTTSPHGEEYHGVTDFIEGVMVVTRSRLYLLQVECSSLLLKLDGLYNIP
jgi:hypothetical protein